MLLFFVIDGFFELNMVCEYNYNFWFLFLFLVWEIKSWKFEVYVFVSFM